MKTVRQLGILTLLIILVLVLGLTGYAVWVLSTANAMVASAIEIRSTAGAKSQIETWRRRRQGSYSTMSNSFGQVSYEIQLENTLLMRLHLVPETVLTLSIMMDHNELHLVTLAMASGTKLRDGPVVAVWEWFTTDSRRIIRVNDRLKPLKAWVDITNGIPEADRKELLSLNTHCLVLVGGCKAAEDMLPGVWTKGHMENHYSRNKILHVAEHLRRPRLAQAANVWSRRVV